MDWFVYMVGCKDGSIYTGSTTDVDKRFAKHLSKKGAKYTRSHRPLKILRVERYPSRSHALKREAAIKRMTRPKKLELIAGN